MLRFLIRAGFIGFTLLMPVAAVAAEPLLMDGKTSLFQRVLVRDETPRLSAPDGAASGTLAPLQPLFVYERDGDWLRVGLSDDGSDLFWVAAGDTVVWQQNIVATFEGSDQVQRVLFFANEDAVFKAIESEDPAETAGLMRAAAVEAERGGAVSEDVVALGPRARPDQRQNLYVMPILNSEEAVLETTGGYVNVLKVAVARARPAGTAPQPEVESNIIHSDSDLPDIDRSNFRAGVVFVVDTTMSMQPYITATRGALAEVYRQLSDSQQTDAVSFGLVGYRDNLEGAPDLEYAVRTFVTLQDGGNAQTFLNGIETMTEARSTSRNFREDSYAGIDQALNQLDWTGFGARYIVLVTDAGPREAGDDLSSTGMTAEGLNTLVKEQLDAALAVIHLKTPSGAQDHAAAEAAYRVLARQANQVPLYFDVPGGAADSYREAAGRLGGLIVDQVRGFRDPSDGEDEILIDASEVTEEDPMAAALNSAGRTMQLNYLGRESGAEAPDVFEAYVSDHDFDRPGLTPLSIRLLISKSELSDLNEALQLILKQGDENILAPDKMFNQVLSAAADMSRRPDKVSRNADTTLADATRITELLDGLPYKSRIMTVTEGDWISMSISEQQTILNSLSEKVEMYNRFNAETDQWVDYLGTGAQADDLLYPMKLDGLP